MTPVQALASVFSVIRNASVPYGINTPEEPNISSTRWRTVADHKRRHYFFESALTPNTFWVDLNKLNLAPGAKVIAWASRAPPCGSGQRNAGWKPKVIGMASRPWFCASTVMVS